MLTLSGQVPIFLCPNPVCMNKSFEGLSTIAEENFPNKLLSGAYFLFINRKRTYMKVLYWDNDGFSIWSKRLERGKFAKNESTVISRREFLILLEGIIPKKLHVRFSL